MSITRRTWTDDSGNWTSGTIIDNAELQRIYDDVDARWFVLGTTATGSQNDVSITSSSREADVLLCSNASDLTITGIVAPASPAKPGKRLLIQAVGAGNVFLAYNSSSSSAANRIIGLVSSANTPLRGSSGGTGAGTAELYYDASTSIWRLARHDQGGYITSTFAAGNFTGNGSMTWTLASGDRVSTGYYLRGSRLHYHFQLATSSVGGTPNTLLKIGNGEWGGFTAVNQVFRRVAYANDAGTVVEALLSSNGTSLELSKINGANWAAATDTTYVYGDLEFRVQ